MTEAISKLSQDSITAHHLNLWYGTDGKTSAADRGHHALKDINVEIPAHEITALIGPSGCGKSTFLKTLNRMNDLVPGVHIEGEVCFEGQNIFDKDLDTTWLRKQVGMVFQKANPFPMSIYDNVAYGPRTHGIRNRAELDEIVEKSLRDAAIWDEVKDRLKKSALGLSGGQQQRLCIARALAVEPDVLLMDESTSALDPISTSKIEDLAVELKETVHRHHGHPQHAAGRPCLRQDRLLPAGRAGGVRGHGADLLHAQGQAHRRIHHREVWMMREKFIEQLQTLYRQMTVMGGLCQQAIAVAVKTLEEEEETAKN